MIVKALDHINIRSDDVPATIVFFHDVLDMTVATAPGTNDTEQSAWLLDSNGHPVIHLGSTTLPYPTDERFPFDGGANTGSIHHVALRCRDPAVVRERLEEKGMSFEENFVAEINLTQIFVRESNGIFFELNFFDADQ